MSLLLLKYKCHPDYLRLHWLTNAYIVNPKPAGAELREQVTYLRKEYESVGDQLEQEQSRAAQVSPPFFFL